MLKSIGPKTVPWGTPLVTSLQLQYIHTTIDHHPLSVAFQLVPYPPSGLPVKSTSLQFGDKDVMGNHVKGLVQVQVNDISRLPLIHQRRHSITEGHKIG